MTKVTKVAKRMNFKKARAAVFSNWKVVVDEKEVETAAPKFQVYLRIISDLHSKQSKNVKLPTLIQVNLKGHARGLSDAGMLGDKAFYISTGGWKYDAFVP